MAHFSSRKTLVLLHVLAMVCAVLSGSFQLRSDPSELEGTKFSKIVGKYKLDESDPSLGVPDLGELLVFSLMSNAKLIPEVMEIKEDGDELVLITTVDNETSEIKFKLGEDFLAKKFLNGITYKSVFTMDGDNKLIQSQTTDDVGDIPTIIVREFEGDKMIASYTFDNVTYKRTYSKIKE